VEWLNLAQLTSDNEKLQLLQKTTEIIVNKEPQLMNDFIDHMVAFQADKSAEVRKTVLTFYELAG
jgi:symplekin